MKNLRLFDDPPQTPTPDPGRTAPTVWIRRVMIVSELKPEADVIRDISFRRGLNIIATPEHPGDDTPTVGHSVGKSLLLRLMRFCLGERTFCTRPVRGSIANLFPHGYVLADVEVNCVRWQVARPIGVDSATTSSYVSHNTSLDELLADTAGAERRIDPFIDALNEAVIGAVKSIRLPYARREIDWLDVLCWLARDQRCRHRSHTEWRPKTRDVGTHGTRTEDNHVVLRTVMDLLSPDDSGLITSHKQLLSRQGRNNLEIERDRNLLSHLRTELMEALTLSDDVGDMETFATAAETAAREQRESLERLLEEELENDPVPAAQTAHESIEKQIGAVEREIQLIVDNRAAAETELTQVKEASEQDQLASLAELGEWCHLFLTKENAVANGCPGTADREPGAVDPGRERRIRELTARIEECEQRTVALNLQLRELHNRETATRRELDNAHTQATRMRRPLRRRIAQYELREEQARQFRRRCESLRAGEQQRETLKTRIRDSLEARREADRQWRENRDLLGGHLTFTQTALMKQIIHGLIDINADGLFPRTDDGSRSAGDAMGTSMVFGFDLACLTASICGLGRHPRLLLHDSPREADMEPVIYNRLFRLVGDLEALFAEREPSFQYIVATTTPPPDELAVPPYVRLTLDAREDDGVLLKRRF